ncbi:MULTISPECIES: AsmA family protein [unclassified Carboxylicivirga]|uniref:AsmA family protein n=1 Tax=Carboxylicivirga TaxID=1628153 RepID=UPI003D34D005
MKKLLKIGGLVIVTILLLLLLLPTLFKGKIEGIVKEQINANVKANVNYTDFSLSLIKNFPNLNMGIRGLSVVGHAPFESDTLVYLDEFSTEMGLIGALSGRIEVKSVRLNQLTVNALVLADSTANWDIAMASEVGSEEADTTAGEAAFQVVLDEFIIRDATLNYRDETMGVATRVEGFDMSLSGDMSAQQTNLNVRSAIERLFIDYGKVRYLNGVSVGLSAGIGADMEKQIYTFLDNEFTLNRLALHLDGSVTLREEAVGMDLTLGTSKTDFKSLLALIPEAYLKDIEGLETAGSMHLNATVKGDYVDEEQLPAFTLEMGVQDGKLRYPQLPESVNDIQVALHVTNPGGSADQTEVQLERFHFEVANNPFEASLQLINPVSNPTFDAVAKGRIDLQSLANAIPMDSMDMKGLIETDFSMAGDYAMIEAEAYDKIDAYGRMELKDFFYGSKDLPQGLFIDRAGMQLSARAVELEYFDCRMGKSDFRLQGSVRNYLAYALNDGVLKGSLKHQSKLIDTNEFLAMVGEETEAEGEAEETALVAVPKNLDLTFVSQIDALLYDKLRVEDTRGKITVKNGVVRLNGLQMHLLDGSLQMNGEYNTANVKKPFVDFNFDGKELDLNMTANAFSVVDSLLPIAKNTTGKVSPRFQFSSGLNQKSELVMASINGGGWLRSAAVEVADSKIQNALASTLKNDSYRRMRAEDININFVIEKGNVVVKPFKTKVGGKMVEVQGRQGLDQTINYIITLPVTRKEVAKMAGSLGMALPTSGDDLMVDVLVTGTVTKPQLGFDMNKVKKQVEKELKKEGENLLKNLFKGF